MKKMMFALLVFPFVSLAQLPVIKLSQPTDENTAPTTVTKNYSFILIDSSKGLKDELYLKAKTWLAKTYGSAKTVIELDDKQAGKIIGKGVVAFDEPLDYHKVHHLVKYTLTINVKDNKYRIVLSDFINEGFVDLDKINGYGLLLDDEKFLAMPYSTGVIDRVNSNMNALMDSFKEGMKQTNQDNF